MVEWFEALLGTNHPWRHAIVRLLESPLGGKGVVPEPNGRKETRSCRLTESPALVTNHDSQTVRLSPAAMPPAVACT